MSKNSGYWQVVPDAKSKNLIHAICSAVASPEDLDDLHVTLGYDNRNPLNDIPLSGKKFPAMISGVTLFGANSDILVLLLESPALQEEFCRIHANTNVRFDFKPYRPHITIAYDATEAELECLHNIVMNPIVPPLSLVFENESREDIDESKS